MKRTIRAFVFAAVAGFGLAIGSIGPANALVLSFDENGHGVLDGTPITGSLLADPSNGGALALTYFLGTIVINGDVPILEFGGSGVVSDGLRFTGPSGALSGATADRLIFYSLNDGDGDLADTGLPNNWGTGAVGAPITEASDGSFILLASPNTYIGLSDADSVPEPATLALFSVGLAVLGAARRRKAKA